MAAKDMKVRHWRFRLQARAVAFPFVHAPLLVSPHLDPQGSWSPGDCPTDVSPDQWAYEAALARVQAFWSGCPIHAIRRTAADVLAPGGPWMTLLPIAEPPFGDGQGTTGVHMQFEPGDEILRWRWLSLALPPLIYIAAAMPRGLPFPAGVRVRVLDPSIAPAGEVALLHAHLSAMMPFETLWAELGRKLLRGDVGEISAAADRDNPLPEGDGHRWIECLRKAFLVREILAPHAGHPGLLEDCPRCQLPSAWRNVARHFARDPREMPAPIRVADPRTWDPEREGTFLRDAIHHATRERGPYRRLVLQYLRAKTLLYRHLVADPDAPGLSSFKKAQARIRRYSSRPTSEQLQAEIDGEIGLTLRSVEIRTTPGRWEVLRAGPGPLGSGPLESGWVLHFSRSAGITSARADAQRKLRSTLRARATEARKIASMIRTFPHSLWRVRGLDVAGLEHEGPLWSFVNHLKSTRRTSKLIATRYGRGLEPLRLTIHVGEDFEHLASGLRAVQEPFAWKLVERGDRLGHALALGIEPEQWARWKRCTLGNDHMPMRPWDRLLDIGWLYHAFRRFRLGLPVVDMERLGAEARRLLTRLGWTDPDDGGTLSEHECPSVAESLWLGLGRDDAGRFRSRITALREQVPPHMLEASHNVSLEGDIHLMKLVREPLARLVAQSGVAIEVNPTSNMIIGAMPNPLEQPMFHLRATDPREPAALSVAISTDDPLTFATCLSDEIAYAWAGMVLGSGVPANYARAWLDDAAATSVRMRFTLPRAEKQSRSGTGVSRTDHPRK